LAGGGSGIALLAKALAPVIAADNTQSNKIRFTIPTYLLPEQLLPASLLPHERY
jgi:hypothetical protein